MTDITTRLIQLREEYKKGEQMLSDLEREADDIRQSLLRISGAIQVLEELQDEDEDNGGVDGEP